MGWPVFFGRRSPDFAGHNAELEPVVCDVGLGFGTNFDGDRAGLRHAGGD